MQIFINFIKPQERERVREIFGMPNSLRLVCAAKRGRYPLYVYVCVIVCVCVAVRYSCAMNE